MIFPTHAHNDSITQQRRDTTIQRQGADVIFSWCVESMVRNAHVRSIMPSCMPYLKEHGVLTDEDRCRPT
jgi:hypothetical protein